MKGNFSQLAGQLLGVWKQLGLNQRISVVMAALVVLVGLGSIAFWSGQVDYALLYGRLDDAEAAKVIEALDAAKIPHKIGAGGGAIYIPSDKVHLMRMQLAAKGIPRGDGIGFEIFDKPNFGISDFVQRANYVRALQGELSRTIAQLDEVDAARVMVVLPENRLLMDNQKRPTASVFVRTKGHMQLPPAAVNSIRFLVANSVEGLQPSAVTVVDNRGNVLSDTTEGDPIAGLTSNQLEVRRKVEQHLAKKAESMLEAALGPGQAVVRVAADINLDSVTKVEEKIDPEGQVVRTSTINDEDTETTSASANGAAGISSNITMVEPTNSAPVNSTRTRKKVTNNQYELSRITSNMTQLAGGVKRVSAAVIVASRYEGTGAQRKVVNRSKEELEKLRRIVQSAIGAQVAADGVIGRDEITLEEMPFNEQFGEVTQELGQQVKHQYWFNQIQTFLYPALALGVLAVFWRMLKKTPLEVPMASAADHGQHSRIPGFGHDGGAAAPEWRRGNDMTTEAFNQLLKDNPGNVGQALQTWLARGRSNKPS